ncbi:MAG: alpha/beta hydrolase [Luminiphilus sp.]|nr:alpha/beta hydrolase [Luminiphilus sp.]
MSTALFLSCMASGNAYSSGEEPSISKAQTATSMPVSFEDLLALPNEGTPPQTVPYGPAVEQSLLHFQSPIPARATLLVIHGGCWSNAYDRQHARPMARALAHAGYDVWLAEYRRVGDPGGGWPGTLDDIARAIQHVATLSGEQPWLIGHSAGGHLALLAATDPTLPLKGVLALAAITNLATYARQEGSCPSMVAEFLGGPPESHPDRYTLATVHDKTFLKPIGLILGEADAIVGPDQLTGFAETNTQIIEKSGHFDLIYPATAAFGQVLKALENLTQTGRQRGE